MINQQLKHFKGRFPTIHLIAACLCASIVSITLVLLPSTPVEATRTTAVFETQQDDTPTPQAPSAERTLTKASPTAPEADTTDASDDAAPEAWRSYTVENGDTLSSLFTKAGVSAQTLYRVTHTAEHKKELTRLFPGQTVEFLIEGDELKKLRLIKSQLVSTLVEKTADGYRSTIIERQPEVQHRYVSGDIHNSLFTDAGAAGLPERLIMELASIFGWDVDFALDIRSGDSFSVIYEERYLDGEPIGEGNIVAAQFINQGRDLTALRYTDSNGRSSYYTPDGHSMRKAFLRTPVDFARISSRFSLSRKHPVLNRIRAHKGTDYAARTGTPIKAAGDGKIIWRGTKGGFGRTVIIQHGSNITTLYAHMSNYKRGQQNGSRVRQGDIIGYVGQSGLASGPHLHYEFRLNGVHKNPQTVALPHAAPIPRAEKPAFEAVANTLMTQLESYRATQVAALD